MRYYETALLGRRFPPLIYHLKIKLRPGQAVQVMLRSRSVDAVVIGEREKPSFATLEICEIREYLYPDHQIRLGAFMRDYYGVMLGEALSLMQPFGVTRQKFPESMPKASLAELNPSQTAALRQIEKESVSLLFGPTGSGKTELYIHLFAQALQQKRRALFLMPEISLTPQMQRRLQHYFGDSVAVYHSRMTKKRRREILEKIRSGETLIVAGPRSALFLPLEDLGLIVVDEAHDESYKAQTRPRYHARDMALMLGKLTGAKVVLGSATPSVESFAKHPVTTIDKPFVQTAKKFHFEPVRDELSPLMLQKIEEHQKRGGQMLLFVPTRAHFKHLLCGECGYMATCPFCSVGMSLHLDKHYLQCHYCHYTEPIPQQCPECGGDLYSERIGSAQLVSRLQHEFPSLRIQQFDRDTITTTAKLEKALQRFAGGESDMLVGTQMLAKGHDYPGITLAIILGLDYMLAQPDFRAREKTLALCLQIAGRSGRAKDAEVIIQTNNADFFKTYLNDYGAFVREELLQREALYPPYRHLCRLLFKHKNEEIAQKNMQKVLKTIQCYDIVEIIGHGPAPIARIGDKYRYAILLRSQKRSALLQLIAVLEEGTFEVDMDPVDFS